MTAKIVACLEEWNRRLHYYTGLYLLLFLWLFAVTGLIMNHPNWTSHRAKNRTSDRTVQPPTAGSDLARAREIERQLGLSGEIVFRESQPKAELFSFSVQRPGLGIQVETELSNGRTRVRETTIDSIMTLENMHTHNGMRIVFNEPGPVRDWGMTQIWTFFMDALCVGLVFMVLSSMYMWYQLRQGRIPGLVVTVAGFLSVAFFLWGLR